MAVRIQGEVFPVVSVGSGQPKTVSLSTTSAVSAALSSTIDCVRVWSSVDSFIRFGGSSVVATTSDHPLTAKVPEIMQLNGNAYIAGIVSTGTGTLFISPLE